MSTTTEDKILTSAQKAAIRMDITDPTTSALFAALYDEDLSDAGYLGQDWCKRLAEKMAAAVTAQLAEANERATKAEKERDFLKTEMLSMVYVNEDDEP